MSTEPRKLTVMKMPATVAFANGKIVIEVDASQRADFTDVEFAIKRLREAAIIKEVKPPAPRPTEVAGAAVA